MGFRVSKKEAKKIQSVWCLARFPPWHLPRNNPSREQATLPQSVPLRFDVLTPLFNALATHGTLLHANTDKKEPYNTSTTTL